MRTIVIMIYSSQLKFDRTIFSRLLLLIPILVMTGCGSRQVQDSLVGSTAQRLMTYSIDEMVQQLPARDFDAWSGKSLALNSHFLDDNDIQEYADQRLAVELEQRFGIQVVTNPLAADGTINIFYTSLGTDQGHRGLFLPLGFMPGIDESTRINIITIEQFHGIAEMYYFIGQTGSELRGETIQARTRTDALGLPIITIPISTID